MDRGPNATSSHRSRVLDNVLRWIADEEGCQCRASLHVAPRGTHEVHGTSPFPSSNTVAEYEVLINGLRIAIELGVQRLDVRGDSQLVINQVMKESNCHDVKMTAYCREVRQLEDKFDGLELNHIPRCLNEAADALAKMASGRELVPTGVFASDQYKPSICYEEPERADDGLPTLGLGANQPSAPSDPEVIELDEDPVIQPDPLAD